MPMEMLDTQRKIQTVLETTARELSQYAYIFYRRTEGEELRDTDGTIHQMAELLPKARYGHFWR